MMSLLQVTIEVLIQGQTEKNELRCSTIFHKEGIILLTEEDPSRRFLCVTNGSVADAAGCVGPGRCSTGPPAGRPVVCGRLEPGLLHADDGRLPGSAGERFLPIHSCVS